MMKKIFKLALLLVVLFLGLSYFGIHKLRTGPNLPSGTLALEGLQEPVDILYDSMGVPHIFAESMEDLYLAQGYVHARNRLWQMEMFRRVQQGRLSEIFGESMVETDRFLRTIGLGQAAKEGGPSPDSEVHRLTESYAKGVNAAIAGWKGLLPPEFVLLRFKPEPWEPSLSQGMEKIMAWDLADYQTGPSLAAAREILGDEKLAPIMPHYPEWGVTIVDGWVTDPDPDGDPGGSTEDPPASFPPRVPSTLLAQAILTDDVAKVLELGSVIRASNSWVVGGERSHSGKPLLANDMHLGMTAPNIWFLVGLHAPGFEEVGMSLPGSPGVVAGHSRAVAWGFTNAMVDDSDFFIERVNPDDPTEYLTPDGWVPFQVREETIQVKGADPVRFTVQSTRHGPIITPVESRTGDQLLSFQWVAHSPAGTFEALTKMGQARNVEEFLQGMRDFDNPHQNVVFADTAGAWGYWMGGRVPIRASGTPPHLPVPGWTGEHEWTGWVPFEDKPHLLAPPRGYIATGNNAQGRDERARYVTNGGWFGPYRAQRISELLEAQDLHDAESLLAIQMDGGSSFVDRNLVYAVDAFEAAGLTDLARRLESWNRVADLESREATLFHSWFTHLHNAFMDYYYQGERGYFPAQTLEEALEGGPALDPGLALPPELRTEAAVFASQYAELPWGQAHLLTLDHPMSVVPVLGSLLRFGRSDIPRYGGPYSPNVGPLTGNRPPFKVAWGPSQRHVVDMADPDGSGGFILPGGQSGYPANPHSFDQLELWLEGRLWLLPLDRALVEARSVATHRLEPGNSPG